MIRKINLNKKAEVFGLSFGMIFSIILIVFFIIVAFIAIKSFLSWQKCTQLGLFFKDVKTHSEEAFYSESASFTKTYFLPSSVGYVCFINFSSSPISANPIEKAIYQTIKDIGYTPKDNLYLYSNNNALCLTETTITNIDLTKKNPICFKSISGKLTIKYEKSFDNPLVNVLEA